MTKILRSVSIILLLCGIFITTDFVYSADGTRVIGQACTDGDQCKSDTCEQGFCVCDTPNHCADRYYGTENDWACKPASEDKTNAHFGWLNFCVNKSFQGGSYPEQSTNEVKYPQERKAYMGEGCDDNDSCFSTSCDDTQIDSTSENDPWYESGRKLHICRCYKPPQPLDVVPGTSPGEDLLNQRCSHQYGGTKDWSCVEMISGELTGIDVCKDEDGWYPKTLLEMRKNKNSTLGDNYDPLLQTLNQSFGELLKKPSPKIKIPGVNFSEITKEQNITTDDFGATWIDIPFLGEYIAAIYRYAVILISLIAVIVLIISGLQIITSAGSSDVITSAKKRIVSSVIAIALTAGSYTILYAINPDLVNLKNLKILVVKGKPLEIPPVDSGEVVDLQSPEGQAALAQAIATPGATPVSGNAYVCGNTGTDEQKREDCRKWCEAHPDQNAWAELTIAGTLPQSETQRGLQAPGIRSSARIPKKLIEPLKQVGLAAQNHPEGPFTIQINDSWRSLTRAIKAVCSKFTNNDLVGISEIGVKLSFPGANAHNIATGGAVDTLLFDKDNNVLTNPDFDTPVIFQENGKNCFWENRKKKCVSLNDGKWKRGNRILAELFYSVPGWKRFIGEVWHFDYLPAWQCRTNTCTTTAKGDTRGPVCQCKE